MKTKKRSYPLAILEAKTSIMLPRMTRIDIAKISRENFAGVNGARHTIQRQKKRCVRIAFPIVVHSRSKITSHLWQTMFQCLVCENWVHESCSSLRPGKDMDDIDNPNRDLADGPLVDYDSFDLFICSDCVCKPGGEVLKLYLGHRGWIVCLPTGPGRILPESVDDIPAIEVEAKGQGWSHFWKVYGLQKQQDSTKGLIEEVPASIKRKAEISIQDGIEAKRVRTQNGLQVSDSFSDVSQEDQDAGDFVVVKGEEEEEEICIAPDVALFEDPKSKPVRLDVFLTEDFRERICRCKGVSRVFF